MCHTLMITYLLGPLILFAILLLFIYIILRINVFSGKLKKIYINILMEKEFL